MLSGRLTHENEGVKLYVISTIVMAVGIVVLWVHWLNAEMGGGARSAAGLPPTAPLVMVQQPAPPETVRATPYRMWGGSAIATAAPEETPAPVGSPVAADRFLSTLTPVPVVAMPTWTPSPLPATATPAPRQVQVVVRAYWPDDSPDWCLTWDDDRGCISPLFSGDDWRALTGQAWACDIRWYGYELEVPGIGRGRCLDVGQTFTCTDDEALCTVGLLSALPLGDEHVIYLGYLYGDWGRWQPVG